MILETLIRVVTSPQGPGSARVSASGAVRTVLSMASATGTRHYGRSPPGAAPIRFPFRACWEKYTGALISGRYSRATGSRTGGPTPTMGRASGHNFRTGDRQERDSAIDSRWEEHYGTSWAWHRSGPVHGLANPEWWHATPKQFDDLRSEQAARDARLPDSHRRTTKASSRNIRFKYMPVAMPALRRLRLVSRVSGLCRTIQNEEAAQRQVYNRCVGTFYCATCPYTCATQLVCS